MNPCDRCKQEPRYGTGRYCKECKKIVLAEMKAAGYLQRVPWSMPRTADQKEDVRSTKYGIDR